MHPPTLTETVISNLTYEEFLDLASTKSLEDSCMFTWERCRKKAEEDFGVPQDYFDLPQRKIGLVGPRKISPVRRYVEVLTKHKLTRYCLGTVYEPLAAVHEALRRNDKQIIPYFMEHLGEKEKAALIETIRGGGARFYNYNRFRTGALRKLSECLEIPLPFHIAPREWEVRVEEEKKIPQGLSKGDQVEALLYLVEEGSFWALEEARKLTDVRSIFRAVLRSGDPRLFEYSLPMVTALGLPGGLPENIRPRCFSPTYRPPAVPFFPQPGVPREFYRDAMVGCNPLIYDYLCTVGGNPRDLEIIDAPPKNPVGFYMILQVARLAVPVVRDIDCLILKTEDWDNPSSFIANTLVANKGCLNIIETFLEVFRDHHLSKFSPGEGFPLTRKLVEGFF